MSTVDWKTPSVASHDARGLPVRQITYLRNEAGGTVEPLITRLRHDVIGRQVEQRDPRLANAPKPNLATVYGLAGQVVKVDSVDAGVRTILTGLAGELLRRWDGRGSHWRTTYDNRLRVLTLVENDQPDVETLTYASALADPGLNLRGQLIEQVDASGNVAFTSFNRHGQPLRESRTVTEAGTFSSSRTYSPLGMVLTETDAGDHQRQLFHDIAGQLNTSQLRLNPGGAWQPVLEYARYNAAGQIIEQLAGNQIVSTWTYDDADGRLDTLTAGAPRQDLHQHLQYVYDRVGNVLRINDLAFKPVYFKNHLMDGHRTFSYDSLYRLTRATGHDATPSSDLPGRPMPSDPKNHLNYKQTFTYDHSDNLIRLVHERAVGGYTHQMSIEPNSNRGVRWKEADPIPDFDTLFDCHGNLLAASPGRPLLWNSRDQLASATLLERKNGSNDGEIFRYSQGVRVFKRHEWQASTLPHFHQVIYLPGLEIRTRDNGEQMHVITLPGGRGSVRCLHWVNKKPDDIAQDQLRYSLDDHLGSSVMELDQNARIVSHEGYYPFGGTAWLTAHSAVAVDYKTIRYSGKEMDASGLYYYGMRYCATWLSRWINPDPLGTVDGLNLYRMMGNNPITFVDDQGGMIRPASPTPSQFSIPMRSAPSSPPHSVAGSMVNLSDLSEPVLNPGENPPGKMPPEPDESWSQQAKRLALAAVNSRVGVALLPIGTSSPANAAIVSTIVTAAAQLTVNATVFNPGWSLPGTWDPEGDGSIPPRDVTQGFNRHFAMLNTGVTLAAAVVGAALGPVLGGYVDEWRGTREKAANNALAGEMSTTINRLIAEQSLLDVVTLKAQTALRDQVLEVETLIGITWNTMNMLEKITQLRPARDSGSTVSSRRSSVVSQDSGSVRQRPSINRTLMRSTSNSSFSSARSFEV